jgi:hypothetical protein
MQKVKKKPNVEFGEKIEERIRSLMQVELPLEVLRQTFLSFTGDD